MAFSFNKRLDCLPLLLIALFLLWFVNGFFLADLTSEKLESVRVLQRVWQNHHGHKRNHNSEKLATKSIQKQLYL